MKFSKHSQKWKKPSSCHFLSYLPRKLELNHPSVWLLQRSYLIALQRKDLFGYLSFVWEVILSKYFLYVLNIFFEVNFSFMYSHICTFVTDSTFYVLIQLIKPKYTIFKHEIQSTLYLSMILHLNICSVQRH